MRFAPPTAIAAFAAASLAAAIPAFAAPQTGSIDAASGSLSAPTAVGAGAAAAVRYAALGDGFAAGEGGPADLSGFDSASGDCHRAPQAWPRRFATAKGLALDGTSVIVGGDPATAGHLACDSATLATITTDPNRGEPAQLTQLRAQSPTPGLVTVQVGLTDAGLRDLITTCRTGGDCATTLAVRRQQVAALPATLRTTFGKVKAAAPGARVIVVGYPLLFGGGAAAAVACPALGAVELTGYNQLVRDVEAALAGAARASGLEFVSMLGVLAGHEACSADPWVWPVGITAGALDPTSTYPTDAGHAAMARWVAAYLTKYPKAPVAQKPNRRPVASFTYKRRLGTTNKVILDGSRSADSDGFVKNWTWTVNGTVIKRGKVATITLAKGRTLKVTLTVVDNRNGRASVTRIVSGASTRAR